MTTPYEPLTVSNVLERAADLIEPEGAWTQNTLARSHFRSHVLPQDQNAVCWCASGAVFALAGNDIPLAKQALLQLQDHIRSNYIGGWNDAPNRAQSEVVAALRAAAVAARGEG